jgi:hypothetical protein
MNKIEEVDMDIAEMKISLDNHRKLIKYLDDKVKYLNTKFDRFDASVWNYVHTMNDNMMEINNKVDSVALRVNAH